MEFLDNIDSLSYAVEEDCLVEIAGDFYCIADSNSCSGCKHREYCDGGVEESIYVDFIPPARSVIKTQSDSVRKDSMLEDFKEGSEFYEGAWRESGNGYLGASKKRVYKKIIDMGVVPYKNREINFIIFNFETDEYICLRQRCSKCEHQSYCKNELIKKDSFESVVSVTDLAAQEPRSFTITTKSTGNLERNWVNVFYNDSIRGVGKPYQLFEIFFRKFGVDTEKDYIWFKWVNSRFFYNKEELYNFAYYLSEAGNTSLSEEDRNSFRDLSKSLMEKWGEDFNSFRERFIK